MSEQPSSPSSSSTLVWIVLAALAALAIGFFVLRPTASSAGAKTPADTSATGGDKKKLVIAVIPKGTTHEFWKTVHAGVVKAERELLSLIHI